MPQETGRLFVVVGQGKILALRISHHILRVFRAHGSPQVFPSPIVGINTRDMTERGNKGRLCKIGNKLQ